MKHGQTAIAVDQDNAGDRGTRTSRLMAAGGMLGAIAASSCCVLPLVLFALGATGPWIGQLTALSPYQPVFIAATLGFLGYGYWLVYRKPKAACADGAACEKPLAAWITKSGLWVSTALVLIAITFNYTAPLLLGLI